MVREKEGLFDNLFAIIDILLSIIAFGTAYYLRKYYYTSGLSYSPEYLSAVFMLIPIWFVLLKLSNSTRLHRTRTYSIILIDYLKVVTFGTGSLLFLIFAFKLDDISRIVLFLFAFIDLILMYLVKISIYVYFKNHRSKGMNLRYVVVIGDEQSSQFIDMLENVKEWGYRIAGIITESEEIKLKYGNKYHICSGNTNLSRMLEEKTIDEVVYAHLNPDLEQLKHLIYACEEVGVTFRMQSNLFSMIATKAELEYLDQVPFLRFSNTPTDYWALRAKSLFDYCISFLIIIFSSPMLLAIALIIKLTSEGPVIFKQKRVGLRGREFFVYKFRTMVQNAEELRDKLQDQNEMDGPVFKIKNDPRITKIGHFLRKTSLDEFPQFFNVLRGEMSIVGPRPPIPDEVVHYERWQRRRLSMKPGITCIWQVSGRNDISFENWMKLDMQYIDTWSLKLDLYLFFKTIKIVFLSKGAY